MSLGEVVTIAIVAILFCKPEDIVFLIKSFYKIKDYFLKVKHEITTPFLDQINEIQSEAKDLANPETISEINLYLQKISMLNVSYQGEYSLKAIKQYYYQLIKEKYE
jgi:hypothetical protein